MSVKGRLLRGLAPFWEPADVPVGWPRCTIWCTSETMPRRYSVAEARAQLPTILDEVEAGSKIELTRHGRAVAVVVSMGEYERLSAERIDFKDAYARFLKRYQLQEVGLDKRFAKGARDRSSGRKVEL